MRQQAYLDDNSQTRKTVIERLLDPSRILAMLVFVFLSIITKPYGDPYSIIVTSRNIGVYGFALDPVSNQVRAPLYYYLLYYFNDYYSILQVILSVSVITLLSSISVKLRVKPSIFGFLLPALYMLMTRTYVNSLTLLLLSLLLLATFSLFTDMEALTSGTCMLIIGAIATLSFMLVITRESMLMLPLLAITPWIFLCRENLRIKRTLILFSTALVGGWLFGYLAYSAYISLSGLAPYSEFEWRKLSLWEVYVAFAYTYGSVIPWEVKPADICSYLFFLEIPDSVVIYITLLLRILIVALQVLVSIPFIIGLYKAFKSINLDIYHEISVSYTVFSFLIIGGLFIVKRPGDFFKYFCYILPLSNYFISLGFNTIKEHSSTLYKLCALSYIVMLSLWTLRTLRLRFST